MAKLKRCSFSKEDFQCRDHDRPIDRMDMLPDELLLCIAPHLSFKEVTAASVLSRRWRHVWTFARSLDFDGTNLLLKVNFTRSTLDEARSDYVKWVNGVIALHKESTIDEFRVFFDLNGTYEETIDEWIRYALARKVQRLELDLWDDKGRSYSESYTFPYEILRKNLNDFKYLTKLCMNYVNVNGEALEFILCNCPLLEDLSVSHSVELTALKITGPLPAFKRLEIAWCCNLNSLEICEVNLVHFIYEGSWIDFDLKDVPLLVNVSFWGIITRQLNRILHLLSRNLPKIEALTIDFFEISPWLDTTLHYPAVKLSNLKQLIVTAHVLQDCSLRRPINLIRISPCLQRFELQLMHSSPTIVERKIEKIVRPYAHIKEIKFVGYCDIVYKRRPKGRAHEAALFGFIMIYLISVRLS